MSLLVPCPHHNSTLSTRFDLHIDASTLCITAVNAVVDAAAYVLANSPARSLVIHSPSAGFRMK